MKRLGYFILFIVVLVAGGFAIKAGHFAAEKWFAAKQKEIGERRATAPRPIPFSHAPIDLGETAKQELVKYFFDSFMGATGTATASPTTP